MNNISQNISPQLCGHLVPLRASGYKAECPECGSFWDLDALNAKLRYDATYPAMRSHYDSRIGENKARTLMGWLDTLGIDLSPLAVCEVGFGGGHCLKFLRDNSGKAFGIEAIAENIDHAVSLGIGRDALFLAQALPAELPRKVDLWIFSDSFEHIPDPGAFISWVARNSDSQAQLLIVSPEAGSPSDRLLGRLWPHKMNDHCFHWSKKGLVQFLSSKDFALAASFKPAKYVSLLTITSHLLQKLRVPVRLAQLINRPGFANIRFRFNIGEMGTLFRNCDGHQ